MDGPFDHNEFEHFLKQNAEAHRLYPSEWVWNRIHARMHARRRRTIALLLLLPLLTATALYITEQTIDSRSDLVEKRAPQKENALTTSLVTTPPASTPLVTTPPTTSLVTQLTAPPVTLPVTPLATTESTAIPETPSTTTEISSAPTQETSFISAVAGSAKLAETTTIEAEDRYPLDIESVVNSYQRQLHRPRFRWQLHFTPTVSYRSLNEDQKFIAQARMSSTPSAAAAMTNSTDLASVIRHRPDIGMQLGFTGTYPISKKLDWVTGLQFNVSKYDIAAYNYPSEVATIALMNNWGGTSTVSTITSFRSSGFRSTANWLRNYYYSISLPVGLQWRILGKKQTHWGISATVQPTYVVGNRSYVISVDYQNYAEVPYLINKWNLNVGLETYARFQLGKTDFQIGPQLRYQAMSSFKKGYPVQEHLYDFGIKLGVRLGK